MKTILYNCIPIILNIICLPLWYLEGRIYSYGTIAFIGLLLNSIIIPIYLIIINRRINLSISNVILKKYFLVLLISIFCFSIYMLNIFIYYSFNITISGLWNFLILSSWIIAFIILTIAFIAMYIYYKMKKSNRN